MNKRLKTMMIYTAVAAATMTGVMSAQAAGIFQRASVVKGQDDLGDITIKRVWVGGDDPIFLTEDYDRVWLDENVNVTATSEVNSKGAITGKVKTPMKEIFRYLGGDYQEDGDRVILQLNGDKLELKVGSRDVIFNGTKIENAIAEGQEPDKVNVKTEMGEYNTYLDERYDVIRLPFKEVFTYFQADVGNDTYVMSIFAMVPVMESKNNGPRLEWSAQGYGNRYDTLKDGSMEYLEAAAANLAAVQNEDGGFYPLPDNTEMCQENLAEKVGTLAGASTLDEGATVHALRYLAGYAANTGDTTYMDSLNKGLRYLTANQHSTGGWQMRPTEPEGFNANLYLGEGGTADVLMLLSDLVTEETFSSLEIDRDAIQAALDKGTRFLLDTQLTYHTGLQTKMGGWARQYNDSLDVTMGRTYERESMDTEATTKAARYLMTIKKPSDQVVKAVQTSVKWLDDVKIEDKETVKIFDTTVQNGYDIFLVDGDGTWPVSVEYQNGKAKTVLADVDPKRPNQPKMNDENAKTSDDLILYATRTSVDYYINDLADSLIDEEYPAWVEALNQPDEPDDPNTPDDPDKPEPPIDNGSSGGSSSGSSSSSGSVSRANSGGTWQLADNHWRLLKPDGTYASGTWEQVNGKWYYFGQDTYMVTGWQLINQVWYYLHPVNGDMQTGWLKDSRDGYWYYLDPATGAMATGWKEIGGKKYYFNPAPASPSGWKWNEAEKSWSFEKESGMPSGAMYSDMVTPDGSRTGSDGAQIR